MAGFSSYFMSIVFSPAIISNREVSFKSLLYIYLQNMAENPG
jgi:vesicle coat complex subunit